MIRLRCLTAVATSIMFPAGDHVAGLARSTTALVWQSRGALVRRADWSPRPDGCLYGE